MRRASVVTWDILRATFAHARKSDIKTMAGSLAFTTVLSVIPLLALAFFAVDSLGLLESGYLRLQPWILENLAPGAGSSVNEHIMNFLKNSNLSSVGLVGGAGLLITAVLTLNQFNDAMNRILETPDERKMLRKVSKNAGLMAIMPILITASLMLSALIPLKGLPITLLIDTIAFSLAYGLLPRRRPRMKPLLLSATIMAVLWESTKTGYALYAKKAATYSAVYGSLSAIPLFLIWVFVAWYVLLLGAALLKTMNEQLAPRRTT